MLDLDPVGTRTIPASRSLTRGDLSEIPEYRTLVVNSDVEGEGNLGNVNDRAALSPQS